MVGRKRFLLSFWKCVCFIFSALTAVRHLGALVGPWGSMNTLSSAPSAKRGGERHNRGCLRGGPAVARLRPPLLLPGCSGGFLWRRIQGDLEPGSLALREGVVSCRAWAPSISPIYRLIQKRQVLISFFFSAVNEESVKKGVCHWREEIWDAVTSSGLYSQTSLPFWWVMAGCIAIGSLATTVDWFVSFTLHKPIMCCYNCVIEKGISEEEKRGFPILTISRHSTSEISKGN